MRIRRKPVKKCCRPYGPQPLNQTRAGSVRSRFFLLQINLVDIIKHSVRNGLYIIAAGVDHEVVVFA